MLRVYVHVYAWAGQKSASGVILQELINLDFWDTVSHGLELTELGYFCFSNAEIINTHHHA